MASLPLCCEGVAASIPPSPFLRRDTLDVIRIHTTGLASTRTLEDDLVYLTCEEGKAALYPKPPSISTLLRVARSPASIPFLRPAQSCNANAPHASLPYFFASAISSFEQHRSQTMSMLMGKSLAVCRGP